MKIVMSFLVFLFSTGVFAAAFECPKQIVTQQSLSQKNSNWKVFVAKNGVNILRSIDFYDGNPQKMVQLAPYNANGSQDPQWTFDGVEEVWQVCRYSNTNVSLTQKRNPKPQHCSVKYNKQVATMIDSVDCE